MEKEPSQYRNFLIDEAYKDAKRLENAYYDDNVGIDALIEYQKGLGDNFDLTDAYLEGLSPMTRQLMRILRGGEREG